MALVAAWSHSDSFTWADNSEHLFMPNQAYADSSGAFEIRETKQGETSGESTPPPSQSGWRGASLKESSRSSPHTPPLAWRQHGRGPPGSPGSYAAAKNSAGSRKGANWESSGSYLSSTPVSSHRMGVQNDAASPAERRDPGRGAQKPFQRQTRLPQEFVEEVPESDCRSLKHQLQAVNLENPAAVITVREIKSLVRPGATVEDRLKAYFENFGAVKQVLVPRATVKPTSGNAKKAGNNAKGNRIRSSNVGWVVMEASDAVLSILRIAQHRVQGITVRVEEFRRSSWERETTTEIRKVNSVERSSSSDSTPSTTDSHADKQECLQLDESLYGSLPTASMALMPDALMSPVQCQIQLAWMLAQGWVAPVEATPMQSPLSQVFNASAQELMLAMPESYDD